MLILWVLVLTNEDFSCRLVSWRYLLLCNEWMLFKERVCMTYWEDVLFCDIRGIVGYKRGDGSRWFWNGEFLMIYRVKGGISSVVCG